MSLSDCPRCWDTPCTCGFEYEKWSKEELENQISMLQKVLIEKYPDLKNKKSIDTVGKCANCGVEFHIHKLKPKTASITLNDIKDEGWSDLFYDLYSEYGQDITRKNIESTFEYGEYGSITIEVDQNLNIIGGIIHQI